MQVGTHKDVKQSYNKKYNNNKKVTRHLAYNYCDVVIKWLYTYKQTYKHIWW